MRDRKITKIVDALASQGRVIIWLDCSHKISINRAQWEQQDHFLLPTVGEVVQCVHCPDPPPEAVRQEKTAQQLWREAGCP